MKKITLLLGLVIVSMLVIGCKEISKEPPRYEGTFNKEYRIDNTKMQTQEQKDIADAAMEEFERAMTDVDKIN